MVMSVLSLCIYFEHVHLKNHAHLPPVTFLALQHNHLSISDLSPEGGNVPHFYNPWTQFTYSLCHIQCATKTKITPCY